MQPARLGAWKLCLASTALFELLVLAFPCNAQTVETYQQTNDRIRALSAASHAVPSRDYVIGSGDLLALQVFDVQERTPTQSRLAHGRQFTDMRMDGVAVGPDGLRVDIDGNVWAAAGWAGPGYDGVHIFAPDGTRIGQILLPEGCANVCFGGPKRNRLFMTASQSVYALYDHALATYDAGDTFDHTAAVGFIKIWGLPVEIAARKAPAAQKTQEPKKTLAVSR